MIMAMLNHVKYNGYLTEKTWDVFQSIQIAGLKEKLCEAAVTDQMWVHGGKLPLKKIKNMEIGTSRGRRLLLKEFVYSVCKTRQNTISRKTHRCFLLLK